MGLRAVVERLVKAGARRLYGKALSPNDNSKNQVYLGGSLQAVHLLPVRQIVEDPKDKKRLKGPLDFHWLTSNGLSVAPSAQLILYPDYPEVRLSGFLLKSVGAPKMMASRTPGRVLLFGVREDDSIIAIALDPTDAAAREFIATQDELQAHGVLRELPFPDVGDNDDGFAALMTRLSAIHHRDWIRSWSLNGAGECVPCEAPQCGGYTLEAELGIRRNGRSEPDFLGWEVKSFDVPSLSRAAPGGKALTLMTPEPTGSLYQDDFDEFWRRFSYADRSGKAGREGRKNFGGIYRCGEPAHHLTGLRLHLDGFDAKTGEIDATGKLALVDQKDAAVASWSFVSLLEKWSRKHRRAAYIPFETGLDPRRYRFGSEVELGRGTDFAHLLHAIAKGHVYLDPAIKFENDKFKKRNQFRVARRSLGELYEQYAHASVDAAQRQ